jgi:serine/threonine protein kinase
MYAFTFRFNKTELILGRVSLGKLFERLVQTKKSRPANERRSPLSSQPVIRISSGFIITAWGYYGGGYSRNSPQDHCLYIDMEFCDFNLKTFIHDGTITTPQSRNLAPLSNILYDRGDTNICRNHWDVMEQISMGVEFLHQCNLVHRDLNPTNGTPI